MRYIHGSLAEQLEYEEVESPRVRRTPRPSLTVLTTPEESRHAEAYLSPLAATIVKAAVALGVCLALACVARVVLITMCFSVTSENNAIITQIDDARAAGDELEVKQSIYGNSERVRSIAVDVYGMVPAEAEVTVDAPATVSEQAATAE